jgi:hypothetical protein
MVKTTGMMKRPTESMQQQYMDFGLVHADIIIFYDDLACSSLLVLINKEYYRKKIMP